MQPSQVDMLARSRDLAASHLLVGGRLGLVDIDSVGDVEVILSLLLHGVASNGLHRMTKSQQR